MEKIKWNMDMFKHIFINRFTPGYLISEEKCSDNRMEELLKKEVIQDWLETPFTGSRYEYQRKIEGLRIAINYGKLQPVDFSKLYYKNFNKK